MGWVYLPCWLGWAQIGTEDFGVGEVVAHFDGPDAGAGSDVQDPGGFVNRRQVELIAHGELEHVMAEVEAILFALVVGHDVASILESVVSTTVLDWVPLDTAG